MSNKHTPGPWRVEPFKGDHFERVAIMAESGPVAVISFPDEGDYTANAALICAIPEMLEALRPFAEAAEMFAWPVAEGRTHLIAPGTQLTVGDLRRARGALALCTATAAPSNAPSPERKD